MSAASSASMIVRTLPPYMPKATRQPAAYSGWTRASAARMTANLWQVSVACKIFQKKRPRNLHGLEFLINNLSLGVVLQLHLSC